MQFDEGPITLWSAAAGGASLLAILVAARGRRVDDHPLCRKCGFDLFGLPETSHNCPECGRDLKRKRATRVGHRRTFRRVLTLSFIVFLASASWLGFNGVKKARATDWNQHKPVSWLLRDAKADATHDAALDELIRRIGRKSISDEEIGRVALAAMAHQSDRQQPWAPKWGEFLETAQAARRLSKTDWDRYLAQAADHFDLRLRDEIRIGQPIPLRVTTLPIRGGRRASLLKIAREPVFHLDGQVLVAQGRGGRFDQKGVYEVYIAFPDPKVLWLEPGTHQAGITIDVGRNDYPSPGLPTNTLSVQAHIRRPLTLIDQNASPRVELSFDPEKTATVEGAMKVEVKRDRGDKVLTVTLISAGAPADLAFRGSLRSGALVRDLGWIMFAADQPGERIIPLYDVLNVWDPKTVEIELFPSVEAAERTPDMKRIWGGRIAWYDVPVTTEKPTPR